MLLRKNGKISPQEFLPDYPKSTNPCFFFPAETRTGSTVFEIIAFSSATGFSIKTRTAARNQPARLLFRSRKA
jgi:hypothetical protein